MHAVVPQLVRFQYGRAHTDLHILMYKYRYLKILCGQLVSVIGVHLPHTQYRMDVQIQLFRTIEIQFYPRI